MGKLGTEIMSTLAGIPKAIASLWGGPRHHQQPFREKLHMSYVASLISWSWSFWIGVSVWGGNGPDLDLSTGALPLDSLTINANNEEDKIFM